VGEAVAEAVEVEVPRYAGVDWSWSEHAICVVDETGEVVEQFTVNHSAAGLARMVKALHRHGVVGVGIERGDGPVVQALLDAGLVVFVVASRAVTALRSRYGAAGNKDDRFDAFLLADVLRTDRRRLTPLTVDGPDTFGLRMLVRARQDLVVARVAAHNHLRAHLLTAFPGAVGLFHRLDGGVSLRFLTRFPTAAKAAWLTEKRLAAWLAAAKYTRASTRTPEHLMTHLRAAPPGLPAGPALEAAEAITLQLVALLQSLKDRLAVIEDHIAQALAAHADAAVFTSLPHSGTVRAATLLAEIGDARGRFPSEEALAASAGVSPSTRASGRSRQVVFRHGCNRRLRQAVVDFAGGSRKGSPWAQALYKRARARGASHAHAIRVLARAWIRVIWRCWTDNVPYDPAAHGGIRRLLPAPG
jgi:transposase